VGDQVTLIQFIAIVRLYVIHFIVFSDFRYSMKPKFEAVFAHLAEQGAENIASIGFCWFGFFVGISHGFTFNIFVSHVACLSMNEQGLLDAVQSRRVVPQEAFVCCVAAPVCVQH
jgi:hypothetical protein